MSRRIATWLLASSFVALCAEAATAQVVQLRDGTILVGEIQGADGEGFTLLRSDNGGTLKLRWGHLSQSSAKVLKTSFDLLSTDNVEVLVRADVLVYNNSGDRSVEAVGRIVKEDEGFKYVRRRGANTPVPRNKILRVTERQVPPHDIFTEDEYYNIRLAAVAPGEDADKHIELGNQMMKVRDYAHAEQHFRKAKELGGGRQGLVLDEQIKLLEVRKAAKEEQGILDEIRTNTNRARFKRAAEKIAEFRQKFPQSKLIGDLERLERDYKSGREKKLVRDVALGWYKYIDYFAGRFDRDRKSTLAAAKQYAERGMGKEIRARLAESLELEEAEVESMWRKRNELRAAQTRHFYYSLGSWVLGEQAVLKDTKQGDAESKSEKDEKSEKEKELAEGLKRIRKALERNREAMLRRNGANRQEKEETPEDWWKEASPDQRVTWLKAYYGEFSGDMEMVGAYVAPCTNCAGSGKITTQGTVGTAQSHDCPVCHRTRFKRDIRVR